MKKVFIIVLISSLLLSCKTKQKVVAAVEPITNLNTTTNTDLIEKITENYNNNKLTFSTLNIRATAKYEDKNNTQNVTAEIRIKKDEQILVIIRVLGITLAKAWVTPNSVQYYEKIGGKYFEGDYAGLSQWLGVDLNYQKVQNMFLAKTIEPFNSQEFDATFAENIFQLKNKDNTQNSILFWFFAENYLLQKQQMEQIEKNRKFNVEYAEFQNYKDLLLPSKLNINAQQAKGNTNIAIEYKNIIVNEEVSFVYSVPEGYERIYIEK